MSETAMAEIWAWHLDHLVSKVSNNNKIFSHCFEGSVFCGVVHINSKEWKESEGY